MSPRDCEAEISAFIRAKGITRCPTACATPTQASGSAADRSTLRQRAEQREGAREAARQERLRQLQLCTLIVA
jgi:hypothetical protein